MRFWKMEAVGNDFVLVHGEDTLGHDLPTLAREVCARGFGIGSDGLLTLQGRELRMFNPDGSEDFCGNGLRCAAVHARAMGWIEDADVIQHFGRTVRVWITGPSCARVELPPASFAPDDIPLLAEAELFQGELRLGEEALTASSLSTGSAHTVLIEPEPPADERFFRVSQELEAHPLFPERTSVMWTTPLAERKLRMRPFERGAGETQGCGTGSAAVAVTWSRLKGVTGQLEIVNTGGSVMVHLEDWRGPILLESEVKETFQGVWEASLHAKS